MRARLGFHPTPCFHDATLKLLAAGPAPPSVGTGERQGTGTREDRRYGEELLEIVAGNSADALVKDHLTADHRSMDPDPFLRP